MIEAIKWCDAIGPESPVRDHGFGTVRDHILEFEGVYFHAKTVAGVAYGIQHPDRGVLAASDFNGEAAARSLKLLGFTTFTAAQLWPPDLGVEYPNRTAIRGAFGGNWVAGIIQFPGEAVVNLFSDEEGPYADEAPDPVKPFEYRGEGRTGDQTLVRGNKILDQARRERRAVRYWYRPAGGTFKFVTWVAILSRAQVWSPDDNKELRLEYSFQVLAIPSPETDTWSLQARKQIDDQEIEDTPPPSPSAQTTTKEEWLKNYLEYVKPFGEIPGRNHQGRGPTKGQRNLYPRSRRARDAVLIRAGNECENDGCTGMPSDRTPSGAAILEVDHVDDLALNGPDHPGVMIALCPNCHAAKTRGRNRAALKRHFRSRVAELHRKALQANQGAQGDRPQRTHE